MKPDDRVKDYWNHLLEEARDGLPLNRHRQGVGRIDDLADRLAHYNEERAREQLRERVRIVGWVFMVGFVVLFLIVIRWAS